MEETAAAGEVYYAFLNSAPENDRGDCDDGDEALSLCDLPLIDQSRMLIDGEEIKSTQPDESQEEFDFCSVPKESEMCAADELFFRGQILPLRHSVSSVCELSIFNRSISRSRSVDCLDSAGGLISSRSSSISSRRSSSSSSGSGSSAAADDKHRKPPLNLFHSHPSPSPKLPPIFRTTAATTTTTKSSAWSIFRRGLIATPPKISLHNAKSRTTNKTSGNRCGGGSDKKKQRSNFLSGCDCLLDAVDTVPSKVVVMKRSANDEQHEIRTMTEKTTKKRVSENRTSEWLKLLTVESSPDVTAPNGTVDAKGEERI
ncbi:probable membrane-associated kinase regulator 1 [Andrographis paniculata]|uniref:probable membrane-associated kinase regulator 1 n=1 Tax=Andrographis paniculata TaxID=175694 RepID=UPI0021E7F466|nr:probable membrane-associated kinase regulator 1 [Andrographis paniculata]